MFRVVEDASGQTKVFLTATNEFLCIVNERVSRKRSQSEDIEDNECKRKSFERRSFNNPSKKLKNECLVSATAESLANESTEICLPQGSLVSDDQDEPRKKIEFLKLFSLISSNASNTGRRDPPVNISHLATCVPISCSRMRGYLHCLKTVDTALAVEAYEKHCSLRFLLRTPTFNGFPVVYREPKCSKMCHMYCFNREQRQERRRYLATGLNRRARRLRTRCKPATVELRRLTAAEIFMWKHGRLNRLSLESVPCLQPRCVVSDVRELVCNGLVSHVALSDEARAKLGAPKSPSRRRSLAGSPRKPAVGKENMCKNGWQSLCHTGAVVNGH